MRHGKYRFITGFLAIPLVLYLVFVIWPYLQAFQISLTDWSGYESTMNYVGFDNYDRLIHDSDFWTALGHNLILLAILPIVTLAFGLFLAFMINVGGKRKPGQAAAGVRGSAFYKIAFFFPQVLSVAIVGILFQSVYEPQEGLLAGFIKVLGFDGDQNWLGDPQLALWCIMAVMVWSSVGFYVVLFSAAMGAIPKEIYEAVVLDGANRSTTFFKITLPLIRDTVQAGWIYLGIAAMDSFALIQIMTAGNPGGPDNSTLVVPLYLYQTAFDQQNFGYGSTLGVAMLIVTLLFAVITFRFSRRDRIEF